VRAFNAISYAKLSVDAHRQGEFVGVPIAGVDPHAIDIASSLIREIGFDPVVIGGLSMGKYLVPGTPLGGEHTAAEIRQDRNEPPLSGRSDWSRRACAVVREQLARTLFLKASPLNHNP
jgi:hypothetical protein